AVALVTPLIIRVARHIGVVDQIGERRMHEEPKPRIGGIAVFFGFAFALFVILGLALSQAHAFFSVQAGASRESQLQQLGDQLDAAHNLIGLLFGSMLILAVGIWDDLMG